MFSHDTESCGQDPPSAGDQFDVEAQAKYPSFRLFFTSAKRRNANLKMRVFNELDVLDSQNDAFEKQ